MPEYDCMHSTSQYNFPTHPQALLLPSLTAPEPIRCELLMSVYRDVKIFASVSLDEQMCIYTLCINVYIPIRYNVTIPN